MTRRLSIRWRLTLVYGSLFFAAAVILMVVNYFALDKIISRPIDMRAVAPIAPGASGSLEDQVQEAVGMYRASVSSWVLVWSVLAVLLFGPLGLALGLAVARRALRPLERVTEAARRLSDSTLDRRIALAGPHDEIRELADTFDSMLERLDRAFDGQRRFVANASHELRTPLAVDRALLQVSLAELPGELAGVREALLASNVRQERLIDGLLLLASSERELTSVAWVDLASLAAPLVGGASAALETAAVMGDAVLLERVVVNLVENAGKYNDARGQVWVRTWTAGGWSFLEVENTGAVVPAGAVEGLFEPFRRLAGDRTGPGAGLGLSIVRAVARAHGGHVVAVPRREGGLQVTVHLPRA